MVAGVEHLQLSPTAHNAPTGPHQCYTALFLHTEILTIVPRRPRRSREANIDVMPSRARCILLLRPSTPSLCLPNVPLPSAWHVHQNGVRLYGEIVADLSHQEASGGPGSSSLLTHACLKSMAANTSNFKPVKSGFSDYSRPWSASESVTRTLLHKILAFVRSASIRGGERVPRG